MSRLKKKLLLLLLRLSTLVSIQSFFTYPLMENKPFLSMIQNEKRKKTHKIHRNFILNRLSFTIEYESQIYYWIECVFGEQAG